MVCSKLNSYVSDACNKVKEYIPSPKTLAVATAVTAAVGGYFAYNLNFSNTTSADPREICFPHFFLGFEVPFLFNCVSKDKIEHFLPSVKNEICEAEPIAQIANTILVTSEAVYENFANVSECVDTVINTSATFVEKAIESSNEVFAHAIAYIPEGVINVSHSITSKATEISTGLIERILPTVFTVFAIALPFLVSKKSASQIEVAPQSHIWSQSSNDEQLSLNPSRHRQKWRVKSTKPQKNNRSNFSEFATRNPFDLSEDPQIQVPKKHKTKPSKSKFTSTTQDAQKTSDVESPKMPAAEKPKNVFLVSPAPKPSFASALNNGRTYAQVAGPSNLFASPLPIVTEEDVQQDQNSAQLSQELSDQVDVQIDQRNVDEVKNQQEMLIHNAIQNLVLSRVGFARYFSSSLRDLPLEMVTSSGQKISGAFFANSQFLNHVEYIPENGNQIGLARNGYYLRPLGIDNYRFTHDLTLGEIVMKTLLQFNRKNRGNSSTSEPEGRAQMDTVPQMYQRMVVQHPNIPILTAPFLNELVLQGRRGYEKILNNWTRRSRATESSDEMKFFFPA